jgi:hemolysin activation/secretion protein
MNLQTSFAAVPAVLNQETNFTDAGRVGNQLQNNLPRAPKFAPKPKLLRPDQQSQATKASKLKFKLMNVIITGNTVYSTAELRKIFQPKLNKTITLSELQDMVHVVTTKYREAGYVLSRAILPPQIIKDGVVHVHVIEGFVSGVIVKGNVTGSQKCLIRAYGEHIAAGKPLQIHTLQRYALIANDLPGYTVQAVLTPSPTVPAAADITLITTRARASGFISYDNWGTRYLGPQETTHGINLYSVFVPGDSNAYRFTVTGRPQELRFVEFIHSRPLDTNGTRLQVGSNYTETRPGFVLNPVSIVGRNLLVFTDISHPWVRDRSFNFLTHTAFNYQNVNSGILGFPFYQDRIRSVVIGAVLDSIDEWHGINNLSFDATHGMAIWGSGFHNEQSRPQGQSNYTRLNLSASRLQALNPRFSLLIAMHTQYSYEPLLATEQFGVGGPDLGRGYDPSEIVGDSGFSGKLELRFDTIPQWKFLQSVQYFTFYDMGVIWNKDLRDFPNRQSLMSVGVGARFLFLPQLTGTFFFGKPFTRPVATMVALNENGNQVRSFFQLVLNV